MRAVFVLLVVALAAVAAKPSGERIVGGSVTTIQQWPSMAGMMYSRTGLSFAQACGGVIINNMNVLSAAHCFWGDTASQWRVRVGSSFRSSGGTIFNLQRILNHPSYNTRTLDNDISVLRISGAFSFGTSVRSASIAGTNYNLPDNSVVWATGWGTTSSGGSMSEQLRHVQIWTVNQAICRTRYANSGRTVTDNMLCSGWLDVGGRDQCQGDSGGPLYHNNVVVGICSWGAGCAQAQFPGVNARVSRFATWITSNA